MFMQIVMLSDSCGHCVRPLNGYMVYQNQMPGNISAHFKSTTQVTIVFKEIINELLLKTQIKMFVVWVYLFAMCYRSQFLPSN